MGNPTAKLKGQKQTELFVEHSQAFYTLRPIGIFALKENGNNMKLYENIITVFFFVRDLRVNIYRLC